MPPEDAVRTFIERARVFAGCPVQVSLHQQRLARRIASEHRHRFTGDDLLQASRRAGAAVPRRGTR